MGGGRCFRGEKQETKIGSVKEWGEVTLRKKKEIMIIIIER